jgi:hypothetical protein
MVTGQHALALTQFRLNQKRCALKYVYHPASAGAPEAIPKLLLSRPHRISAIIITERHARGTLLCHGSVAGGHALYVEDRCVRYYASYLGGRSIRMCARNLLPLGRCEVRLEYQPVPARDVASGAGSPGRVRMWVGGLLQASLTLPMGMPLLLALASRASQPGMQDRVLTQCYEQAPFASGYDLRRVAVEVHAELQVDTREEMGAIMASQCGD